MEEIRLKIDRWFSYHAPNDGQLAQYMAIRSAARKFAQALADNAPDCADRTVAIRKVREAVMNANAAVACEEK